jgi:hypothetical protein
MSAAKTVETVLTAVNLLTPLVEQVADYIAGGDEPLILEHLPSELRSRLALERAKRRSSAG